MSNAEEQMDDTTNQSHPADLPSGMRRLGADGKLIIDASSGRHSVFGFGCAPLQAVLRSSLAACVGDSAAMIDRDPTRSDPLDSQEGDGEFPNDDQHTHELTQRIREIFEDDSSVPTENLFLRPSADAAVDTAIALARRYQPEKAFRTIALVGSDHGRTGMTRSASGRPELHDGFGPMMAGFSHVPAGDVDALRASVDEQTACVLLSPVDFGHGAVACDAEYLAAVREICDERDLLLVMDETQLVLGASGKLLTFAAIARIHADIAVISAGLFAGLPGGLVLSTARVAPTPIHDLERFPVQAAVAASTLAAMQHQSLPRTLGDDAHPLTVAIAKALSGYEFIRDIHAIGTTIGIETDLDSGEIVRAARRSGLRLAHAGSTAVRIQPPLVIRDEEQALLLTRLSSAMESLERSSAELAI